MSNDVLFSLYTPFSSQHQWGQGQGQEERRRSGLREPKGYKEEPPSGEPQFSTMYWFKGKGSLLPATESGEPRLRTTDQGASPPMCQDIWFNSTNPLLSAETVMEGDDA